MQQFQGANQRSSGAGSPRRTHSLRPILYRYLGSDAGRSTADQSSERFQRIQSQRQIARSTVHFHITFTHKMHGARYARASECFVATHRNRNAELVASHQSHDTGEGDPIACGFYSPHMPSR